MTSKQNQQPSPIYVFVVISLAAFLTLFTLWRRPRPQYVASVVVPVAASYGDQAAKQSHSGHINSLRQQLLNADFVMQSLKNAGIMKGEAKPEMLDIADEIASRMRLDLFNSQNNTVLKLSMLTKHPVVGTTVLDQMVQDYQSSIGASATAPTASAATASRVRGESIHASSLVLLILCSALVGIGGLMLLEQSKETAVLLTENEVMATTQLPVLADFSRHLAVPARTRQLAWRRRFRTAVSVAEIAIAAAIVLMIYNMATQHSFSNLLFSDPLSAYSDAVCRILG